MLTLNRILPSFLGTTTIFLRCNNNCRWRSHAPAGFSDVDAFIKPTRIYVLINIHHQVLRNSFRVAVWLGKQLLRISIWSLKSALSCYNLLGTVKIHFQIPLNLLFLLISQLQFTKLCQIAGLVMWWYHLVLIPLILHILLFVHWSDSWGSCVGINDSWSRWIE